MKGKITLIQILLVFVLCICGVTLYDDIIDKRHDEQEFEDLKIEQTAKPSDEELTEDENARLERYRQLHAQNNDFVGWIKIPDTNIDYPVVQNKQSNAYYLHRDFEREYSSSGIPFMDYQCKSDATGDNTIIYAHNMRNGTMFHDLLKYADTDFFDAHKMVEFDSTQGSLKYEVFAVIRTKVGSKNEFKYYNFINAKTPSEFDKFISECIKRSIYNTGIIPQLGEKILTLSTCSYNTDNERFVVFARKTTV